MGYRLVAGILGVVLAACTVGQRAAPPSDDAIAATKRAVDAANQRAMDNARASVDPKILAETFAKRDCDGAPPPCMENPAKGAITIPRTGLPAPPDDGPAAIFRAEANATTLFDDKRFEDLDKLIGRYSTLHDRGDDGRFKLSGIETFISAIAEYRQRQDSLKNVELWRSANPHSPGAALLEAAVWRQAAWQARGGGYASSVLPEGQQLFHERLERAMNSLTASEPYAASNPLWYMQALDVKLELGASLGEQFGLYDRAIKAFPEFFPLDFNMIRALLPKWGGSNEAIAAFIESVVKRSPPPLKAQMYTRLWWYVDQSSALEVDLFRDMGASWPRMRDGFESLEKSYPDSVWIRSNFASIACRAGDATSYVRLRAELGDKINYYAKRAFQSNASLEVCDAHAAGKPI
jgi:hypothetical protein